MGQDIHIPNTTPLSVFTLCFLTSTGLLLQLRAEDEELLFRVCVTDLSPQWGGAAKVVKDRKPPVSVQWLRRKEQRS